MESKFNKRDNLIIRKMNYKDINEVSKIENESFKDPWPTTVFLELLMDKNVVAIVAEGDKKIIGYGIGIKEDKIFCIANLAVEKNYRRKGIGSKILSQLLDKQKDVILEVRKSNIGAIKLYKKFNFIECGEVKNYYPDGESAIIMRKKCKAKSVKRKITTQTLKLLVLSGSFSLFGLHFAFCSTSLIPPPFGHTMGYYRITPTEVKLIMGKTVEFSAPYGITCCKFKATDDPTTYADDDELTVLATNSWAHQIVYNQGLKKIDTYGKLGSGVGEFFYPYGIAAHPNGYIYVADCGNHRVVKLKIMTTNDIVDSVVWVKSIGGFGCADGKFDSPYDVAIDTRGFLYVADYGNNRIQIFDTLDNFIKKIEEGINKPIAVAVVDSEEPWSYYEENFIVVIDNNGLRIQKIDAQKVTKIEFQDIGLEDAKFTDCAIDYYNNIWVADKKNRCIHKFDHNLKYITAVRREEINEPQSIAIWRRYGQFFVLEEAAISYFWIGVDGYIEGCYPEIFNPKEKGTTITIFLTEPAYVSADIYDEKGNLVRNFLPVYETEPFAHNIVWDGRDNKGDIVAPGEYKIKIKIGPTYSAKGYFSKELETKVTCIE